MSQTWAAFHELGAKTKAERMGDGAMINETEAIETLFAIQVSATAASTSTYHCGHRHAMLAFTEASEIDGAYAAVEAALIEAGWSSIGFGRVKDITGKTSHISDEIVRSQAEKAFDCKIFLLVYKQPINTSEV